MATQPAISAQDRGKPRQGRATRFAPRRFSERSWRLYRLQRTTELIEHVGGSPNTLQRDRIDRLVELNWELRKLVMAGGLSIDRRLKLEKQIARYERELGLDPQAAQPVATVTDPRETTYRRALSDLLKSQREAAE